MKKKIFTAIAIIIVITIGIVNSIKLFRERKPNTSINVTGTKALVVYYSAQGHTENVAKTIAENLNADIFKIEPKEEYTSADLNYNDSNSRVTKEHNDESLRNIELKTTKVDNWNEPSLDTKTRCIITVVALISSGITDNSLKYHLENAKKNGVTKEELAGIITHTAFYVGWPKAWAAFNLAQEIY